MKKVLCILMATVLFASAFCLGVFAEEPEAASGAYDISTNTNVGIEFYPAVGNTAIEASSVKLGKNGQEVDDFYADAERFSITATGKANKQYLLLVCSSDEAPCKENTVYVNQAGADHTGKIEFSGKNMVYPRSMNAGTYYVYIIGEERPYVDAASAAASYRTYSAYPLGDVNFDDRIDSDDALLVLKHSVRLITLDANAQLAADVNLDGKIDSDDALLILKYSVHMILKF